MEEALVRERALLRVWSNRGTLHMIAVEDWDLIVSALNPPHGRPMFIKMMQVWPVP